MLRQFTHYVPVKEDLSDLIEQLDWADAHPDRAATIAAAALGFARMYLTKDAALRGLRAALLTTAAEGRDALVKAAAWRAVASGDS